MRLKRWAKIQEQDFVGDDIVEFETAGEEEDIRSALAFEHMADAVAEEYGN